MAFDWLLAELRARRLYLLLLPGVSRGCECDCEAFDAERLLVIGPLLFVKDDSGELAFLECDSSFITFAVETPFLLAKDGVIEDELGELTSKCVCRNALCGVLDAMS